MRIKLLRDFVGKPPLSYKAGAVVDWPEENAAILVARGLAEAVGAVETAMQQPSPAREVSDAKDLGTTAERSTSKRTGKRGRAKRADSDTTG